MDDESEDSMDGYIEIIVDNSSNPYTSKYRIVRKRAKHKKPITMKKCLMCDFETRWPSLLKTHTKSHTGERPHQCDVCDYAAPTAGRLNEHKKIHSEMKTYKCHLCDYKCVRISCLNRHLEIHSDLKPYKCDFCDYTARLLFTLKTHVRAKHTREKNHKCPNCNYRCVTKSGVNSHLKTHVAKNTKTDKSPSVFPYNCDMCDYKTYYKKCMTKHVHEHNTIDIIL